jgi:ABC-type polysaccharide/polyol phosphate export permease
MVAEATAGKGYLMYIFKLNPFVHLFSIYRLGMGYKYPSALNLTTSFLYLIVWAVVALTVGLLLFGAKERRFAKLI